MPNKKRKNRSDAKAASGNSPPSKNPSQVKTSSFPNKIIYVILSCIGIGVIIYWITQYFAEPEVEVPEFLKTNLSPEALQNTVCKAGLNSYEAIQSCLKATCEQAAELLHGPILNKRPDAQITLLPGGQGLGLTHNVQDYLPLNRDLFNLFNENYTDILLSDATCAIRKKLADLSILDTQQWLFNWSMDELRSIKDLARITSFVGVQNCFGRNSWAALVYQQQRALRDHFIFKVIGSNTTNGFDHAVTHIVDGSDKLVGICDIWNPNLSEGLISTYCGIDQIITETEDTGCQIYDPSLISEVISVDVLSTFKNAGMTLKSEANLLITQAMFRVAELRQHSSPIASTCKQIYSQFHIYIP